MTVKGSNKVSISRHRLVGAREEFEPTKKNLKKDVFSFNNNKDSLKPLNTIKDNLFKVSSARK